MTYKVELVHSAQGYSAICSDLPGCVSKGETEEQAISNIRNVIGEYLAVKPAEDSPRQVRFVDVPQPPEPGATNRVPFVIKPFMMNLPAEWTSHKVEDLLDILEGPDRRW